MGLPEGRGEWRIAHIRGAKTHQLNALINAEGARFGSGVL